MLKKKKKKQILLTQFSFLRDERKVSITEGGEELE